MIWDLCKEHFDQGGFVAYQYWDIKGFFGDFDELINLLKDSIFLYTEPLKDGLKSQKILRDSTA